MESNFWTPFSASLLAALVTTAGIYVIRYFEGWGRRNTSYFAYFAAGVLVSVSFLHIIPRAFDMSPQAPVFLFAGFLFMHLLNRFLTTFVGARPEQADYVLGLVPLVGIGFHSFIDGVIYSVTFTVSFFTGALAALGMVLHEFPEGIVTYLLMLRGGFSKKSAFFSALVAAAATTPLGMVVSYPVISRIDTPLLSALLALSAGALVYVGATHLLPRAEREPRPFGLLAFGAGIAVAVVIILGKA
jgi:zinc transporter ZupT